MSKRQFKSQASSSRAFASSGAFGGAGLSSGAAFGSASSSLSYLAEQPDLTNVSDPNVVVSFKNLSKKDSTTKAKALEDLQAHVTPLVEQKQELEEAFIEAWVKVYPRASVDLARRVRQVSHSLQSQICQCAGKRIARFMPALVGAWMAGQHDPDKTVARAAQDAFQNIFSSSDKQLNVLKVYQLPILEFAKDALLQESEKTLSDERTTTPEDAEAKYLRLVASCIALVDNLVNTLADEELLKHNETYDELLTSGEFWEFAGSKDSGVRKAIFRLLRTCMNKRKDMLETNIAHITEALLSKQAVKHQGGSALDFSQTLTTFSAAYPSIWLQKLKGKTSAISRIADICRNGSQGASSEFWLNIARTCRSIPEDMLPEDSNEIKKLLSAVHAGVTRKDEPRTNLADAWTCYISLCVRFTSKLDQEQQKVVLKDTAFPLVRQYLTPSSEDSEWNLPNANAAQIVASMLQNPLIASVAESEWDSVAKNLLERVRTSAPEQSKDYDASQSAVASQGNRLFSLAGQLVRGNCPEDFRQEIYRTASELLQGCTQALETRNGKPYGAATVAESIVRALTPAVFDNEDLSQPLSNFVSDKLPGLVDSRSNVQLVNILMECHEQPLFIQAWTSTLDAALNLPDSPHKVKVLQQLLTSPWTPSKPSNTIENETLQAFIRRNAHRAISGEEAWTSLAGLLAGPGDILASATADEVLSDMIEALNVDEDAVNAMSGLRLLASRNQKLLKQFLQASHGAHLLQRLLSLTESENEEVVQAATETNTLVQSVTAGSAVDLPSTSTLIENGLYEADAGSLTVDTLVDLAQQQLTSSESAGSDRLGHILPSSDKWSNAIQPLLNAPPTEAFALTDSLGGAVYLVEHSDALEAHSKISRDKYGHSTAMRMAIFVIKIFNSNKKSFMELPDARRAEIFRLLLLTSQLANDEISLAGNNGIWVSSEPISEDAELLELVSDANACIKTWQQDRMVQESTREALFAAATGRSPSAYHNGRGFSYLVSQAIEEHGAKADAEVEGKLRTLRKSKDPLPFLSYLTAYKSLLSHSPAYNRMCNELIADLTGISLAKSPGEALQELIYLNLFVQDEEHVVDTIAKQRMIFFVKHVTPWLQDESASLPLVAETCKALTTLLPAMKDVYGDHWSNVLTFLQDFWSSLPQLNPELAKSATVSLVHASLRMTAMLRNLIADADCNDDLKDAWQEGLPKLSSALINVLTQLGQVPDENNQPLAIANELLGRQIQRMPAAKTQNVQELFPLMTAESQHVQRIAFELLHKQIPSQQEEISVNVVLEKSDARLPDELLSLIVDPPTLDSLVDASFDRTMPLPLRSYLSSWLLVFDHFKKSSDKVKTDYIAHLKSGDYLSGLLAFTFDFLGHSRGKPLDPSKLAIQTYSFDIEPSPLRDTHWLLCHLYYLCLKRLPALTKSWWMECKSRQTVVNVESWTERYVSPLVIADALTTVAEWAETQTSLPDEEQLVVKPNQRTKEITVSKEIDEQMMSLVIRLPANYPLGQATLAGINRVAVDEKKWRSWMLNSQGVIAFSNNSLVDGIVAFRRNVVGALKGQTECAICYSVVGPDKQLPTKVCGTCKNKFHGNCLFKWFKSSNSSTCPLCRQTFSYT